MFGVLWGAQSGGGVSLGIGVDHQDVEIVGRQGRSYINRSGGLTNTALLIGDCEDAAQAVMLSRLEASRAPQAVMAITIEGFTRAPQAVMAIAIEGLTRAAGGHGVHD